MVTAAWSIVHELRKERHGMLQCLENRDAALECKMYASRLKMQQKGVSKDPTRVALDQLGCRRALPASY